MVTIRLARGGAKKRPFYQIVVADQRAKRDGRHIEQLGYFNPLVEAGDARLRLDKERLDFWVGRGAQMSNRVKSLVREWRKLDTAQSSGEEAAA
ncbi:MAG: 30S ribosomal protein S16 [Methylothermaceae bacterium]|nr:30S ribosomal protein S16 [Methylothermaceae bacterium]